MGSLVAAGGLAGACFWLPVYPVSACPLLSLPSHVPHVMQFHVDVGMYWLICLRAQVRSVRCNR